MRKYVTTNYTILEKAFGKNLENGVFPSLQELLSILDYPKYVLNEEVSDEEDRSNTKRIIIRKNEFLNDYPIIEEIFTFCEQQVNKASTHQRRNENNPNEENEEILESDESNDEELQNENANDAEVENEESDDNQSRADEALLQLLHRFHE
jgi:hypothetical protein